MPSVWFKHKNKDVLPHEVHYDEGQDVDAIVASNAVDGWTRFSPKADEAAAMRTAQVPSVSPDAPAGTNPKE